MRAVVHCILPGRAVGPPLPLTFRSTFVTTIGYIVGSLSSTSINRALVEAIA